MKYSRVHRLLRILTLIQSGREWNAERIAAECGITPRTVYRDLQALEEAGIPYHFDDTKGGYQVRRDFFLPPVDLTLEEALALACLADTAAEEEQIPFMKPAVRAVAKVLSQLPPTIRETVEESYQHTELRLAAAMPSDGIVDVYERVRTAILQRRPLICSYESPKRHIATTPAADVQPDNDPGGAAPSEEIFRFEPYCLFFSQRAWYAIGYHAGRDDCRCLKLNRFTRLEDAAGHYEIPADFSLKTYLGNAWRMIRGEPSYEIELQFDAAFAETVADTHWHATQHIEWQPDGSILFRCQVDGLDEIVWWVLSMGPHCVVNKPPELAERVKELSEATAAQYLGREGNSEHNLAGD